MRVGLDTSVLSKPGTGVHSYAYDLLRALLALSSQHTFSLLCRSVNWRNDYLPPEALASARVSARVWRVPGMALQWSWKLCGRPKLVTLIGRVDVFHLLDSQFVPAPKAKLVVTVHDMVPFLFPNLFPVNSGRDHRARIAHAVKRADLVIADSHSTKADLLRLLAINEDKVRVVHCGVDATVWRRASEEQCRVTLKGYGIARPYLLSVGVLEPRKNYVRLIQAYQECTETLGLALDLVIVGKRGWLYEPVFRVVDQLGLNERVRFLGRVTRMDLRALLSCAAAFAYPSLYEGFGFPVLEAMAVGVPVVVANISSLPEVAGDSAILVDPHRVDSIAAGIAAAVSLSDEERRRRIAAGELRVASFSWARTAAQTMDVYESLAG